MLAGTLDACVVRGVIMLYSSVCTVVYVWLSWCYSVCTAVYEWLLWCYSVCTVVYVWLLWDRGAAFFMPTAINSLWKWGHQLLVVKAWWVTRIF